MATGKVCQDSSLSESTETLTLAVVADGHGGARYFRSDVGSRIAVEVVRECVSTFVSAADPMLFRDKPLTRKESVATETRSTHPTKETATDKALRQLFSSIIYTWRQKIVAHAESTPITEAELTAVDTRHTEAFVRGEGVEKTYGCTLLCCATTPSYWFAFQIGDGKCVAFDTAGRWTEPVPWDERCFLNKTTSLCDSSAIDEFRYCYEGDGGRPLAVFLGSDGIDDSFGETENMVNFYVQVLKLLSGEGEANARAAIETTLPELSGIGSKDDMSIAVLYDETMLAESVPLLVEWQKDNVATALAATNSRIERLRDTMRQLEAGGLDSQKAMIDHQYAARQVDKAFAQKRTLAEKWNRFARELYGEAFTPYTDEIGFGDEPHPGDDPQPTE